MIRWVHSHPHGSNRILFRKHETHTHTQNHRKITKNSRDPLSKSCRKPNILKTESIHLTQSSTHTQRISMNRTETLKCCRIIIDTLQRNRFNSTHFNTHTKHTFEHYTTPNNAEWCSNTKRGFERIQKSSKANVENIPNVYFVVVGWRKRWWKYTLKTILTEHSGRRERQIMEVDEITFERT